MSFTWCISFTRAGKPTLERVSVAVNSCTLLKEIHLTAEFFFLKDTRLQHFNIFSKILIFLYEKKNCWILHEFINNFQTTEIHKFDKQLPVMVKSYQALHHRTLKNLPRGIQFCTDSGSYSGSLNLMCPWMNPVPQHQKRSVTKTSSSLSGNMANTHMTHWRNKIKACLGSENHA